MHYLCTRKTKKGSVAQLYRASDYGSEGYRLESCRGHLKMNHLRNIVGGFFVRARQLHAHF